MTHQQGKIDQYFHYISCQKFNIYPDSKVHEANMGPIWGRQDPGGPHVAPMNFAIWVIFIHTVVDEMWSILAIYCEYNNSSTDSITIQMLA